MSTVSSAALKLTDFFNACLDQMDVQQNIAKAEQTAATQKHTAIGYWVIACAYAVMTAIMTFFVWYYDIENTVVTFQGIFSNLFGSVGAWGVPVYIIQLMLAFTPTILELLAPALARNGLLVPRVLLFIVLIVDFTTDTPRAVEFVQNFAWMQGQWWFLGDVIYMMFFAGWLFMCSLGFEVFWCICFVLTWVHFNSAINPNGIRVKKGVIDGTYRESNNARDGFQNKRN
jgi:hypothetical protein